MLQTTDVIQGALKLLGLPDDKCWSSFSEFLQDFPNLYGVEISNKITNVIVSNAQPLDSERDTVWIRTDNSGSFIGIFLYGAGTWQQMFPAPNQLFRMYGLSTSLPAGFTLATHVNVPAITTAMETQLKTGWYPAPPSAGPYTVFDAVFTGF